VLKSPNNQPVPELARAQRAQDAKHAGLTLCKGQRVLDLLTREQGEIVSGERTADGSGESYQVALDDPPWLQPKKNGADGAAPAAAVNTLRLVVRALKELEPIPSGLLCDVADLENPKL
jgi:hypothetical protein